MEAVFPSFRSDCRRPSEKERERNTEIKADYRRPSEGEEENIEMRAGDESGLHRLLLDSVL